MDFSTGHTYEPRQLKRSLDTFVDHHHDHQQHPSATASTTTTVELRGLHPLKRHCAKPPSPAMDLPGPWIAQTSSPAFTPPQYTATPPIDASPMYGFFSSTAAAGGAAAAAATAGDADMVDAIEMPPSPISDAAGVEEERFDGKCTNSHCTVDGGNGSSGGGSQSDTLYITSALRAAAEVHVPMKPIPQPSTNFRMGFREDCEKCRMHMPGHFGHLDGRWLVPGR